MCFYRQYDESLLLRSGITLAQQMMAMHLHCMTDGTLQEASALLQPRGRAQIFCGQGGSATG